MTEVDRRIFLRALISPFVGFTTATIVGPVIAGLGDGMQQLLGYPTGNAGIQALAEDSCRDALNTEECIQDFRLPDSEKTVSTVIAPVFEEGLFRATPSFVLSIRDRNEDNPLGILIGGTGRIGMTRRELGVGIISSVLFAVGHNLTQGGFDANTIPAHLAVMGFGLWYLQRKFGALASISAHVTNNTLASLPPRI